MCLPTPRRGPPPPSSSAAARASSQQSKQSEKERNRSSDNSLPSSPDTRRRSGRRADYYSTTTHDNELPLGRVAAPGSRSSSSARYSAPPPSRRKSSRRQDGGEGRDRRAAATPNKRAGTGTPGKKQGGTTPRMSDLDYKLSGVTPRSSSSSKTAAAKRSTPGTSAQTTPRLGVPKHATSSSVGSPKKGTTSARAFSTTSSQGRLSVATTTTTTTTADAASVAASTSPLLKPTTSSSRASSVAGSSGSDVGERRKSTKSSGAEGLIGLGIMTEGTPKKKNDAVPLRTVPAKAPTMKALTAEEPKPRAAPAPPPVIKVHAAGFPETVNISPVKALPPPTAANSEAPIRMAANVEALVTPTKQHVVQPEPVAVRKSSSTGSVTPKLNRKHSSASLNSEYSTSSVSSTLTDSTTQMPPSEPEPVPESTKVLLLAEAPIVAVTPPANEPVKPTLRTKKDPVTPLRRASVTNFAQKRAAELSAEKSDALVTPIRRMPSGRQSRSSSRASNDTVDYATFVAESQKKKRQQKKQSSLSPNPESPTIPGTRRASSVRARARLFPTNPPADQKTKLPKEPASPGTLIRLKNSSTSSSTPSSTPSSSASSTTTSLAPEPDIPHRALRRAAKDPLARLSKPAASSTHPYPEAAAASRPPPEAPIPPPYAPSPPAAAARHHHRRRRDGRNTELPGGAAPPPNAAESWYEELGKGPREVEPDWRNAGEIWEDGEDATCLPEAPSPPPSRGAAPPPRDDGGGGGGEGGRRRKRKGKGSGSSSSRKQQQQQQQQQRYRQPGWYEYGY